MSSRDDVVRAVTDLRASFGTNAFLLFTMGLRLNTADYDQIYRDSVLDGPDDKKVDFFHIDRDAGCVVVAQGYESRDWHENEPPSNKASDLNTATSWLLDAEIDAIPRPSVQAAARELRDALESGAANTVEVYYVHNCTSSKNVDHELATVECSLRNKLERWAARAGSPISAVARQLALSDVVALHDSRYSSIRVRDTIHVRTASPPQWVSGPNWRAVYTTVRGEDLVELVDKYGEEIYTANIRDYLGWRASTRNINRQIAETASQDPDNFWVFNNGVSLISRRVEQHEDALECSGLADMNGAQTLGSLAQAARSSSLKDVKVLVRVVQSDDEQLVQQIIRYNNTQNPIKPWELRVLDPVQKRIERDFADKLSITYQFRRGLERRAPGDVLCEKLGPWLNSFYGDPITSHRNSPELFDDETKYRRLFSESSDVRHLLFVYRLGEAIGASKDEYRRSVEQETASETDATLYGYFRYGAFTHAVLHVCAEILAELFGGGPNVKKRFVLSDAVARDRERAVALMKKVVKFTLAPIPSELAHEDAYQQLRSSAGIERLGSRVRVTVNQMRSVSPEIVEKLKEGIELL
jgi:hypothetical protein